VFILGLLFYWNHTPTA